MSSKRRPQASRRKQPRSAKPKRTFTSISPSKNAKPPSDREFEAIKRSFHAIARMRHDNLSLDAASHEEGTTPATVKKYLPAALRRSKSGRWAATKPDRYLRPVKLPGVQGPVFRLARGSEESELASHYLSSLQRWSRRRKTYELTPFKGKTVGGYELITDERTLRALQDAGLLQLDSLYASLRETI